MSYILFKDNELYGHGDLKHVNELIKDYVLTCELYGNDYVEFAIEKEGSMSEKGTHSISLVDDELETVNAAYQDLSKENSTMKSELKRLKKSNDKMNRTLSRLGKRDLEMMKEIRKLGGNYKQFTKGERDAQQ